jgi:hypothetical protein
MDKKILIIEDNIAEAIYAQAELAKAGIKDFKAVTTLSEGLESMTKYDALLSDLFFPVGNESTEKYIQRFLPVYEGYKQRKFPKISGDNVILKAIESCAKVLEITPKEYVEDFLVKTNSPRSMIDAANDALAKVKNSEKYEKFLKIEEEIRNGTNLPLGIIASERASELGIPCAIVTSTYHHDDAFEAVNNLIKVPYSDRLVEGKKDWKGGIELLLK